MPVIDYKKNLTEALKVMNKKTWNYCSHKNNFIKGLITDGDLRRGI